jgi:hypothetical protein
VKLKTKALKRIKGNIQGKHLRKKTLKRRLFTVDNSGDERQDIPRGEQSNDVYVTVSEKRNCRFY